MLNLLKIKRENKFTDKINKYYIEDYPPNYDIKNLPHKNTLEDAKKICKENNCSGITYEYNRYEVRNGKYIKYINNDKITS